jgi:hypothetical protein
MASGALFAIVLLNLPFGFDEASVTRRRAAAGKEPYATGMPRRALRRSFVVTFALGAAAIAGGCSSQDSGNGNGLIGDGSIGDGSTGDGSTGVVFCNPPNACYCFDACGIVDDAGPGVDDAAPDVSDAGPDGEGQDGGQIADGTGDVAPDAGSD